MFHSFYGGTHPADRKEATRQIAVAKLDVAPEQVVLPMSMHVGAPCKPIVQVGDKVLLGQKIAEPTGLGAPIHSSVSGEVVAVEPRPHTNGSRVMAVVIKNDGNDTPAPIEAGRKYGEQALQSLSPEEIITVARESGLVGMGGAGFPTHVKIQSSLGKVDALLINGAECEPYITADHRLMLERPDAILAGVRLLMRAMSLDHACIGIEGNKQDAIETMQNQLAGKTDITIQSMHTRYPQGSEKQLIQRLTGRQVPPGGLPASVGCAIFNVATAAALYDAVKDGKPLTHRIVTITGDGVNNPCNLLAPIGTPINHLIAAAGGFKGTPSRVLSGGPMMGAALYDLSAPLPKGGNAIVALTQEECTLFDGGSPVCIRCGRCVAACPMHLTPVFFHMYGKEGRLRELEPLHIMDCIECGACAYSCPARIELVHSIRTSKQKIRKLAEDEKKAKEQQKAKEEKV